MFKIIIKLEIKKNWEVMNLKNAFSVFGNKIADLSFI